MDVTPFDPDDDWAGRRADVRIAIRAVETRRELFEWAVLLLSGLGAWYFRGALTVVQMALAALLLIVLVAIHDQLCAMRIDALRRELRDLALGCGRRSSGASRSRRPMFGP